MSESSSDARIFERLQGLLLNVDDISAVLTELAVVATEVVPQPVSCGITLRYDAHLLTVGSSDGRAELLDEAQYAAAGGPCLQSLATGLVVDVPDLRSEVRWPPYVATAVTTGQRCSVSLPLRVGEGDAFGAMNVYGFDEPRLFGPDQRARLEIFAAQAAGTLRIATRQLKDATMLAQMDEALRSRTVIDQALGIVMALQRCTAAEAFDLLRSQSQNSHQRLRDVASALIERTTGSAPDVGRGFDPS